MTMMRTAQGQRDHAHHAQGYLGKRISRVEHHGQLVPVRSALNYSLNLDRISIGPDYPIFV